MEKSKENNLDILKSFIEETVTNACKTMLQGLSLGQNLEKGIGQDAISFEPLKNGENTMASKYKERVKVGVDQNGKPIERWAAGDTKEELQRNIAMLLIESGALNLSNEPKPEPREKDTTPKWKEYASNWFEVFHKAKVREKTWTKDRGIMNKHVLPMFGEKRIGSITSADVQKQLNQRAALSRSYVRDIMQLMKQIFDSAVDDEILRRSPMDSKKVFNPSRVAAKERKALTPADQADIIANISKLENVNDRMFVAFLMFTGMRPSEIYGMMWKNIDFEHHVIKIDQALTFTQGKGILGKTKTESGNRVIPMDERLEGYLLPNRATGFVFKPARGSSEFYTEQAAKRSWQRICRTIDMHGMIPYEARHTYATNLSRNGIPMKTAMMLMGHKDERPLNRNYIHVDETDIMAAGKVMSDYLSSLQPRKEAL